jgi:transcriptional regulator with GAF, ATPase, and Fis domain
VKPIPETVAAAEEISSSTDTPDLLPAIQDLADQVQALVPDCMGLSLAWKEHDITFTLVASDQEIAAFDALQYLQDGPCLHAVTEGHGLAFNHEDLMAEEAWQMFAQATAAAGVRSTLTIPLTVEGETIGSANLYGASDHAFEGHVEDLAELLGGWAPGAVRNADLTFATRLRAERAPASLHDEGLISRAVGIVMVRDSVDSSAARSRIEDAARRAGIRPAQLADALIKLQA